MQLYPGRHGRVQAKQVSGSGLGKRNDIPSLGISQHRQYPLKRKEECENNVGDLTLPENPKVVGIP